MHNKQTIAHFRQFLTLLLQHKQRKAADNTFPPTFNYFNTVYAADNTLSPTPGYNGTMWVGVVKKLLKCIIGCYVLEAG